MSGYSLRNRLFASFISVAILVPVVVSAGGITLGGTRIIYPAGSKQVSMSVHNTSENSSFLVQSWVEQDKEQKSQDFVVTPPLYVSSPGNENILRLIYVGQPVQTDKETLYYFNTKAIPSVNKSETENKNVLMLAAVTRIKLFVRPDGLKPTAEQAPSELLFHYARNQLKITNPTPYYITLAQMKVGDQKLADTMVSPRSDVSLPLPSVKGSTITFRTINDYGAVTPEQHAEIK